ncbi:hypothetical protein A6R68_09924, partial [Neotoma lepida]
MDGKSLKILFTGNLEHLEFVTLDIQEQKLYWAVTSRGVIERGNVDGTERMILVHHLAHPWGLAVHGSFLYYSDEQYEVIERVDKSSGSNKVVLRDNVPNLRGLRVYHRRRNLYFTNAFVYETLIEVLRINTTYRRVLLKVTVDMPRHIVVDPKNRYLFWADYGQKPKIERSFLDCTNRTVLVSEGIVTPRGLAMDHSTGYIYWVDDSLDIIARIHLDGGESQVVRYGSRYPTPYGITVFGESIIWVDRNLKKIFQASKEPGNTDPPVVIRDNVNLLRDVTIFDEHVQPLSPAELNNNPCLQ